MNPCAGVARTRANLGSGIKGACIYISSLNANDRSTVELRQRVRPNPALAIDRRTLQSLITET
jgi:hypothetical protein